MLVEVVTRRDPGRRLHMACCRCRAGASLLVRNLAKAWPPDRETPVDGAFHKLHICGPRVKPKVPPEVQTVVCWSVHVAPC